MILSHFFAGRFRYLTLTDTDKVWMPDTFFRNEKQGHFHSILVNNVYVRVFPNGDVLYSIRYYKLKNIHITLHTPGSWLVRFIRSGKNTHDPTTVFP